MLKADYADDKTLCGSVYDPSIRRYNSSGSRTPGLLRGVKSGSTSGRLGDWPLEEADETDSVRSWKPRWRGSSSPGGSYGAFGARYKEYEPDEKPGGARASTSRSGTFEAFRGIGEAGGSEKEYEAGSSYVPRSPNRPRWGFNRSKPRSRAGSAASSADIETDKHDQPKSRFFGLGRSKSTRSTGTQSHLGKREKIGEWSRKPRFARRHSRGRSGGSVTSKSGRSSIRSSIASGTSNGSEADKSVVASEKSGPKGGRGREEVIIEEPGRPHDGGIVETGERGARGEEGDTRPVEATERETPSRVTQSRPRDISLWDWRTRSAGDYIPYRPYHRPDFFLGEPRDSAAFARRLGSSQWDRPSIWRESSGVEDELNDLRRRGARVEPPGPSDEEWFQEDRGEEGIPPVDHEPPSPPPPPRGPASEQSEAGSVSSVDRGPTRLQRCLGSIADLTISGVKSGYQGAKTSYKSDRSDGKGFFSSTGHAGSRFVKDGGKGVLRSIFTDDYDALADATRQTVGRPRKPEEIGEVFEPLTPSEADEDMSLAEFFHLDEVWHKRQSLIREMKLRQAEEERARGSYSLWSRMKGEEHPTTRSARLEKEEKFQKMYGAYMTNSRLPTTDSRPKSMAEVDRLATEYGEKWKARRDSCSVPVPHTLTVEDEEEEEEEKREDGGLAARQISLPTKFNDSAVDLSFDKWVDPYTRAMNPTSQTPKPRHHGTECNLSQAISRTRSFLEDAVEEDVLKDAVKEDVLMELDRLSSWADMGEWKRQESHHPDLGSRLKSARDRLSALTDDADGDEKVRLKSATEVLSRAYGVYFPVTEIGEDDETVTNPVSATIPSVYMYV